MQKLRKSIFDLGKQRGWWEPEVKHHIISNEAHNYVRIPIQGFLRYALVENRYTHAQILICVREVIYSYYPECANSNIFLYISNTTNVKKLLQEQYITL